jgi:hypothetical protein
LYSFKDLLDRFQFSISGNGEMNPANPESGEELTEPRKEDTIKISGHSDNCEGAKQALLALVPISAEVSHI